MVIDTRTIRVGAAATATMELLRDRSPEARVLGGWYARVVVDVGFTRHVRESDFCRSRVEAAREALRLAYGLKR